MRPISKENERTGGTANKTNPTVNRWLSRAGKAGPVLLAVGATQSANNISNAPEAQRGCVIAQETGSWAGALAFGAAGAKGGAVIGSIFGPIGTGVGAFIGGIGGGIVGSILGAEAGANYYTYYSK
jgi:phage tail tape-measure protein